MDAFYIACKNNRIDMLSMLMEIFKVRSDHRVKDTYYECTGFIEACR